MPHLIFLENYLRSLKLEGDATPLVNAKRKKYVHFKSIFPEPEWSKNNQEKESMDTSHYRMDQTILMQALILSHDRRA